MEREEQLKFFTTFKEEIDFEILLENIFLEFIKEKENENSYSNN